MGAASVERILARAVPDKCSLPAIVDEVFEKRSSIILRL